RQPRPTVKAILDEHVTLSVECLDRLFLNRHEWVKHPLEKEGIAFEALDNLDLRVQVVTIFNTCAAVVCHSLLRSLSSYGQYRRWPTLELRWSWAWPFT
ncbi:MAG TPA: hypothetical protein P5055_06290, partial [Candidatus Paceibacterota bacterium]|nr:hypothetical protein [Candidatus Paceibacterota bacterium]